MQKYKLMRFHINELKILLSKSEIQKDQNVKTKCGPCNCSSRSLLSETWTLQSKRIKTWRPSVDLATAQAEVCFLKPEPYSRKESKHEDQVWTMKLLKQKSAFWNLNPTVEKNQNMKTKCGPCNCSRSSLLSKTWTLQSKRSKHEDQVWTLQLLKK